MTLRRGITLLQAFLACSLFWAVTASGQSGQIERLLERQLSSDGRIVEIDGFTGALSSEARMQALRISDADGVWLTIENAALDWTQSALLRGRIEVQTLTAERLTVLRKPKPTDNLPDAEASGLGIPDIPIAIDVQQFSLDEVILEEDVLGSAFVGRLTARARLDSGRLDAELLAERLDSVQGEIALLIDFDRPSETLEINVSVDEPQGGIVAAALGLPGRPALSLDVSGSGPFDALDVDLRLATDGVDRLTGQVALEGRGASRRFEGALTGDIRPLLDANSQSFFGPDTGLRFTGQAEENGTLDLSSLRLETQAMSLNGRLRLDAERALEVLTVELELLDQEQGASVQLPGTEVELKRAVLDVAYDRTQGDDVAVEAIVEDLRGSGIAMEDIRLSAQGVEVAQGSETPLSGEIDLRVSGFSALENQGLSAALGRNVDVQTGFAVLRSGALKLSDLVLTAETGRASGNFNVARVEDQIRIRTNLDIDLPSLVPFSALAGTPLAGSLATGVTAEAELPGGSVQVSLTGTSTGLDVASSLLRPLLAPETMLALAITRDTAGTRIDQFLLENTEVSASAEGEIDSTDGTVSLQARLRDAGLLDTRLAGPVTLEAALQDIQNDLDIVADLQAAFGLTAAVRGQLAGGASAVDLTGTLSEVERFAAPLSGPARIEARLDLAGQYPDVQALLSLQPGIEANVSGLISGPSAQLELSASIEEVGTFVSQLPGSAQLDGTLDLAGEGLPFDVELSGRQDLTAQLSGTLATATPTLIAAAEVPDLGRFISPLPGRAALSATVKNFTTSPDVTARIDTARGISLNVAGRPLGSDGEIQLSADIENAGLWVPQLAGPATLDARVSDPTGNLRIDTRVTASRGFSAQINGRPLDAADGLTLRINARNFGIFVPQLPGEATLSGKVRDLNGALSVEGELSARGLNASLQGALAPPQDAVELNVRLNRLAAFAPDLTGGARLTGEVSNLRSTPNVAMQLQTDSGARARVSGALAPGGSGTNLSLQGALPIGLASSFVGNRSLSGTANFDLALRDSLSVTGLSGQVQVNDARLFDPSINVTVEKLSGTIGLAGGRARIAATGTANQGRLTTTGNIGLQAPYQTNLDLQIQRFAYALRDIVKTRVEANLKLTGPATSRIVVSGRVGLFDTEVRVPDGGFGGATAIPDIRHVGDGALIRTTRRRAGLENATRSKTSGGGSVVLPLDVTVDAVDPIFVRGRGLDTSFGGRLVIRGTTARPEPVGAFNLRRGRFEFLGRRLDLTDGRIVAAGTQIPFVSVTAQTIAEDLTAKIVLEGPANAPELTLSSVPDRPQDEILAQILFGRNVENLSAFQIARLIASLQTLAGGRPGTLEFARRRLNVDNLDVQTNAAGQTELTIGQNLSENIYSDVEIDSAGNSKLNLNLDLNANTTLRGSVSNDGETGIGVFWERDY